MYNIDQGVHTKYEGDGVFVYICLQACDFYQNNNKDCNKRRILSWGGLKGWGCEIVF